LKPVFSHASLETNCRFFPLLLARSTPLHTSLPLSLFSISPSLSLTHTDTHTHTRSLSHTLSSALVSEGEREVKMERGRDLSIHTHPHWHYFYYHYYYCYRLRFTTSYMCVRARGAYPLVVNRREYTLFCRYSSFSVLQPPFILMETIL